MEKKFKKHMMYKDCKEIMANTMNDHLKLKKKGYTHTKSKDCKSKSPAKKADPKRTIGKGKNFNKVSKDKSATGGAAGGGMTEKGVREYKRNNPGSKLKTAVTKIHLN